MAGAVTRRRDTEFGRPSTLTYSHRIRYNRVDVSANTIQLSVYGFVRSVVNDNL